MIRSRWLGILHVHTMALAIVVTIAFWLAFWVLRLAGWRYVPFTVDTYLACNALAVIGVSVATLRIGGGNPQSILDPKNCPKLTLEQTVWVGLLIFLALFASRMNEMVSRLFVFGFLVILYAALYPANYFLPKWLRQILFRSYHQQSALLMGEASVVQDTVLRLKTLESCGVKIVGVLSDEVGAGELLAGIPVLGNTDSLYRTLRRKRIGQVIYLGIPPDMKRLKWIMLAAEECGCRLALYNNISDLLRFPVNTFNYDGMEFLTFREEPLENPINRVLKRLVDVAAALVVVLAVLPPLAAVVWVLQRFQSPGQLFYRQVRAGLQNRPFYIWKFRTLHPIKHDATAQVTQHDSRVYPAGRWLRRLSLDEIPQFINVLVGDMSIVGPRPHMLKHNKQFASAMQTYNVRTLVKPGITGLAQVAGYRGEAKDDADIANRVRKDIEYIEQWSLWLDARLLVQTALQIFRPPKSAY